MKRYSIAMALLCLCGCQLLPTTTARVGLGTAIDAQSVDVVRYARSVSTHDEEAASAYEAARGRRDWVAALAVWPLVQNDALAGIAAGPQSEGVKDSFREQVKRLDSALRKEVAR